MAKIDIEKLTVKFFDGNSSVLAIDGVDLAIEEGEFVCILGESGCGKSTLIRTVAGLQSPSSGAIGIDGERVIGASSKCGFVFQSPALLPWLSVRKNVELGLKIQNKVVNRSTIDDILKLVDLSEFKDTKPKNLSGGMAQRAAIARALVNEQEILLMDEPFSALDEMTRFNMQNEMLRIWKLRNITVLFITHDIDEAIRIASRIVVMTPRPGRIAKSYSLDSSFNRDPVSPDFMKLKKEITDMFVQFDTIESTLV